MSRSAPIIPVNAAMYRHFAIATLFITGTLAMFASGENREAMQDHLEARQRAFAAQEAERNMAAQGKGGNSKTNLMDKRKVKGSFSSDSDVTWKAPADARSNGGHASSAEAELVAGDAVTFSDSAAAGAGSGPNAFAASSAPPPGMSPAEYEQMTSQKKKKKKPAPRERAMTRPEMNAMIAASEARSQTRRD